MSSTEKRSTVGKSTGVNVGELVDMAQERHKSQPKTQSDDVLNYDEARKYFAGQALNGMLSECRLGQNLSKTQMDDVCRRAAYMGTILADTMC